jgi:poly(3-hydroxybutyrate) depolymerase
MRLLSAALILTISAVACTARAAPQQVEIAAGALKLHAQLYKPEGNGPFPAVIALHGCGGLSAPNEPVAPRYREWAEQGAGPARARRRCRGLA